jgi:hypothetical protein
MIIWHMSMIFSPGKDFSYGLQSHANEDLNFNTLYCYLKGVYLKLVAFNCEDVTYLLKGKVVTFNNKNIFIILLN